MLLGLWFGGRAWYFSPAVDDGELAKDFTAVRADGQSFKLTDLRGSYVLLDFWGSWCGPCRRESPELVALQQKMQGRLTIVSVAIERDSSAWQRARTQDARDWPYQVMDRTDSFRFLGGEVASLYGVKQVPLNFLIDPQGYIVAVNAALSDLPKLVAEGISAASPALN